MQEKEETHPLFGLVHFNEIADKYHLTGRVILPYNYGGFVQDIVMRTNAGGKKNYYVCGIDAGEAYDGHALCGSPAAWENSSWSKEWSQGTRSNIWCWAFAFPPSPVFFEVNVEKGKDLVVPVYSLNE